MVHHHQVGAGERGNDDEHHREGAVRDPDRETRQRDPEQQQTAVEVDGFTEGDLVAVLGRHVEHGLAEQRLETATEADVEHRAEQQRAVQEVRQKRALPPLLPVGQDVVEHRGDQEDYRRHQHPQREADRVAHERQDEDVDHDVDREYRRQRQAVGEEDDVQLLVPLHLGEQDLPGVAQDELHVPLGPLAMAPGERQVVDRELLFAEDVRGETGEEALEPSFDGEADVFGHHVREHHGGLVALTADHGPVTEQRQEAEAVFDRLVGRPVGVHAGREHLHEAVRVVGGVVVGLDDAGALVGSEVVEHPLDEVAGHDLVAVQDHEKVPELQRVGQEVVQVAGLEADGPVGAPDYAQPVLGGEGVDLLLVVGLGTVVEDDDLEVRVALTHRLA